MEDQYLFQEMKPSPKERKISKAHKIRLMYNSRISPKSISESTGFALGYVNRVIKQDKIRTLKNMPVGYIFKYVGRTLEFISYSKCPEGNVFVNFTNEKGRKENILLADLLEENV